MLPPQVAYHVRKALQWTCLAGSVAAVAAWLLGGWQGALGVAGGAAAMAGALEVSALRSVALLTAGARGKKTWSLLWRTGWLLATMVAFGVLVVVVKVPGWSVALGVTACLAGSVVGFLSRAAEEKAREG